MFKQKNIIALIFFLLFGGFFCTQFVFADDSEQAVSIIDSIIIPLSKATKDDIISSNPIIQLNAPNLDTNEIQLNESEYLINPLFDPNLDISKIIDNLEPIYSKTKDIDVNNNQEVDQQYISMVFSIEEKSKKISKNDTIILKGNIKRQKKDQVLLPIQYEIRDAQDNIIFSEIEIIRITDTYYFQKSFNVIKPNDLGNHYLYIQVQEGGVVSVNNDYFEIIPYVEPKIDEVMYPDIIESKTSVKINEKSNLNNSSTIIGQIKYFSKKINLYIYNIIRIIIKYSTNWLY